jgi:hypothetical protein
VVSPNCIDVGFNSSRIVKTNWAKKKNAAPTLMVQSDQFATAPMELSKKISQ